MSRELALPPDLRRLTRPLLSVAGVVVAVASVGMLAVARMLDLLEET